MSTTVTRSWRMDHIYMYKIHRNKKFCFSNENASSQEIIVIRLKRPYKTVESDSRIK